MNKLLLFIAFALLSIGSKAQTLNASYYLDFGLDNGTDGNKTVSPDINGNHWNNILDPAVSATAVSLINSKGASSSIKLNITSTFLRNGRQTGGLLSPSAALLGDFAIATATEDYFYTNTNGKGTLQLTGLDPAKSYVFKIFGTRTTNTQTRISQYKIVGANTSIKTLTTTGNGIGDGGYHGNNNTIAVSDKVTPTSAGIIDIELTKTTGDYGYIGIIKIEEYVPTSYYLDFGLDNGTDGNKTVSPDVNGNYWNNILDPAVSATAVSLINSKGASSAIKLNITSTFLRNGRQTGGLLSPSASLLGDFAITTATEDYFYTNTNGKGALQLTGLDPAKSYIFKIFGTRASNAQTRVSQYKIVGANTSIKTLTTTGNGIGDGGYHGNNNTIAVSDEVTPTSAGVIDIELTKTTGDYGYISIIKIEERTPTASEPVEINEDWTKLYIDLGPNDGTNGNATASPDVNGNRWNNLTDGSTTASTVELKDYTGKITKAYVNVTKSFFTNGIQHGGLLAPSSALLGEYAINTATQDYFFVDNNSGILTFSGLQKKKKYIFHFFGSRETTETRIVEYNLTGANTSSKTLKTSGTGIGNGGYNANNNTVVASDTVYADMNGNIALEVKKNTGSYGHLNIIKIEAFDNTSGAKYAIDNQGFEYGDLRDWTVTTASAQSVAEVGTALPHNGIYSVKLTGDNVALSQQIRHVENNIIYKASGYFYTTSAMQSGQMAFLTLSYFDENNQLLGASQSDTVNVASEANKWKKLVTLLGVPIGTKYVRATVNWANPNHTSGFVYFDDLALEAYVPINPLKIAYFGSSVPYGQGATNKNGYTSLYTGILNARAQNGGKAWQTANISIPGDNTVKVLNRYDSDLLPQKAKYVVYALALGNEGIHENGQPAFDRFKTNMKTLIDQAREDGFTPIVTNSYTRNDYNATDYDYVKQMNLLIHQWDVPSVNLLGAVDDLSGKWVDGYWDDTLHPNDAGHTEMSYTIVPSLFDALDAQKPMPKKVGGSSVTFVKTTTDIKSISFTPENIVHPFTVVFSFKTSASGTLLQIKDASTALGSISVTNGVITYNSAKGGSIVGTTPVNSNQWHKVILTHYYAKGVTVLYCDSIAQGQLSEQLITNNLKIGGADVPEKLEYKDLLFYRSAMNAEEAKYIARDSLLKSSLELYAPLDGKGINLTDSLSNLAQSTNFLSAAITNPTVLPLTFTSFTATLQGLQKKQAVLKWTTAQEININLFLVEKSSDGAVFNTIGNVAAKNTSGINNYTFTDNNPLLGVSYYRLKEVDKNGAVNYSKIIPLKNIEGISVYPNPATDYVMINIPLYLQGGDINIYNLTGKPVYSKAITATSERINLSAFSSGVYMIKIASGNNVHTLKFAKD